MSNDAKLLSKHGNIDVTLGNTIIDITFARENAGSINNVDSPRHMHLFHEIHYIQCGKSCIENDLKEQFFLKDEDICIIPAGVYHSVRLLKNPFKRVCLFFDISKKDSSDFDTYSCLSKVFSNKIEIIPNTLPYFEKISDIFIENKKIDTVVEQKLKYLLSLIFIDFYEKNREAYSGRVDENLKYTGEVRLKIEEFFHNCPADSIKLETLAQKLRLSTRQTDRLLKKYTGSCFRDIAVSMKMEKAKELMRTSGMSLEKIASQLGYSSYAGFCNSFKKIMGITPRKYKQNLKM